MPAAGAGSGFPFALADRPAARTGPLAGCLIAIDSGHGGDDPGASGRGGSFEKDLTLDIGRRLATLLEKAGARVLMIRADDTNVGMYERPALANQAGADVNVSIHMNWYKASSVHGTEVFYYSTHPESARLAEAIRAALVKETGLSDRGTNTEHTFVAIRETTMPSVLVEVVYLTNAAEERLIETEAFRQKVALGLYNGLEAYFAGGQAAGGEQS